MSEEDLTAILACLLYCAAPAVCLKEAKLSCQTRDATEGREHKVFGGICQ